MIVDVVMPKMGESITEGTILEWRKNVGDTIKMDDILLEIGTDKVDSEIPSSTSGVIVEILAKPNDVIEVGKIIARIETKGDATSLKESPTTPKSDEESTFEMVPSKPITPKVFEKLQDDKKHSLGKKRFYTPVVKSIAKKEGISLTELASLSGSGYDGRVTKGDILAYIEQRSTTPVISQTSVRPEPGVTTTPLPLTKPLRDEREEMTKIRQIIAERMRRSLDTAAHVHLMNEVDMTRIVTFVENRNQQFKALEGFSLTYTPFIVAATIRALLAFPEMNSSLDGTEIIHKKNVNIGLAVALKEGLMVPVIPKCEELNFLGICRKVRDLAVRARDKKITPDELTDSTFSISNFGVFNVTTGTPIINQPNVGILGVGTIKKKPVVIKSHEGESIGIRSMMYLSLGFDHRLIDGAGGARFIEMVLNNLENMDLDHLF